MLGWETLQRILSTYFSRYAFRHPTPADFFAVASEVSGRDLTWFFDQVYRSSNAFDYGVDAFRSDPAAARGFFERARGARLLGVRRQRGGAYHTTVVVRRYGDGEFPVDVRIVLENKEEVRWHWDGKDRWKLFEADTPSRAAFAEVDPDHVLLLDLHYTNNSATLSAARPPRRRATGRSTWLVWLQDQLLTYGFFI